MSRGPNVPAAGAGLVLLLTLATGCDEQLRHAPDEAPVPVAAPATVASSQRVTDHIVTASGDLAVAPLEHATLLFIWQGRAIYVDPATPTINETSLPPADVALVTCPHYDHLDPVALFHLSKPGTVVVGSPGAAARAPIDITLREGETRSLPARLQVTAVPAYSIDRGPGPGLRYHERGGSVGYVLDFGGTRVYVSGDTECTPEMKALADIDVAFVSLNVPYAMTAAEATECVSAFRPKVVIPYAYRHAAPTTLDRAALGPGIEVRRRDLYPRSAAIRAEAYRAFTRGMWGLADDELDSARQIDLAGDADWRVQWTRGWLKQYEKLWPW